MDSNSDNLNQEEKIPDNPPEENRDRFLSFVRRIIEETPPTKPYLISKRIEESVWAKLPDKVLPKSEWEGPYIPLALR
jgi:hypothetical protein